MRLTAGEITAIREEIGRLDPKAEVYLYGSRVDDTARGGDVDLLVVSDIAGFPGGVAVAHPDSGSDRLATTGSGGAPPGSSGRAAGGDGAGNGRKIMKRDQARSLLEQGLTELAHARRHLDFSFQQVAGLPDTLEGATEKQLESAEAFTGRFARSVDLLVNKVLRSLDRMELNPEGTLLDVINRAEKRGLVDRAEELREMKDVRNMIAHDYAGAKAAEIFAWCREQKPAFDGICDRAVAHARQNLGSPMKAEN